MNGLREREKRACVGYLFDMDHFLMNVTDNEGWLMNGVPDGEFEEDTRPEVLQNYREHTWLIEDFDGNFDINEFKEFFETFKRCARYTYYDREEVKSMCTEIGDFIRRIEE